MLAANYVPLANYAIDFSLGSRLLEEPKAADARHELRHCPVAQL